MEILLEIPKQKAWDQKYNHAPQADPHCFSDTIAKVPMIKLAITTSKF